MGVQIIKEINLYCSIYCFKNCCVENNSEIFNDNIYSNNFNANDKIPTFSSNKIKINSKNKIKNKKLSKFSYKNNSSLLNSNINTCLSQYYEINNYKIIKLQSYIRKFLVRKKFNLEKINFKKEKKDNENENFLAISLSREGNLFSSNNNSQSIKFNAINRNFLPFNLNSKNNMKYKYFGYMKDFKNNNNKNNKDNEAYYNNYMNNKEINNIKNGFGKIIFNENIIFKSNFIENKASGISQYIDYNKKEEYIGEYKKK